MLAERVDEPPLVGMLPWADAFVSGGVSLAALGSALTAYAIHPVHLRPYPRATVLQSLLPLLCFWFRLQFALCPPC